MKANRLALALALAGLAAPALAEQYQEFHITKVHDYGTMLLEAPDGLAAAPARPSASYGGGGGPGKASIQDLNFSSRSQSAAEGSGGPTIRSSKPKEIVVVGSKLEESTPSSLLLRTPLDAPGLAAAPGLPSAAAAGRRTYEPITFQKRIDHASPLVAPPALRNERPSESLSLNHTKIEKVAPALKTAAPVGPAIRR